MTKGGAIHNILLRKDCTYRRMLEKCVQQIYNDKEREDAMFYIANKAGIPVWSGDKIEVDKESTGMEIEEREWTLGQYLHLSGMTSVSKMKFYCVRKGK